MEPASHLAVSVYQMHSNHFQIIRTCERFVQLLLGAKIDRSFFEAAFTELALDLEKSSLFQIALDIYIHLGRFILKYQNKDDFILADFVISRCKSLKQKDLLINNDTQHRGSLI